MPRTHAMPYRFRTPRYQRRRYTLIGALLALIAACAGWVGPDLRTVHAQGTVTSTPEEKASLVVNYLGLIFTYPADWTAQALPYQDFGFRISSPDITVDPIGRPETGGYLTAIAVPQTAGEWRAYALGLVGERFRVAGLDAIEGPALRDGVYSYRSWQIYGFGQHYTFTFGAAAADFDRLVPIARQIIDQLVFIGTLSAAPRPIQSPVRLAAIPAIVHAFAAGDGKVMSGYNNGAFHAGGDLYALDFCSGGSTCAFMPVGTDVLAPTTMKLVYSLNSLRQDVKDFHFFELSKDYGGRKLCMSFGHMQTTLAMNQTATRGQKIGTILLLDGNANHIHMGMFTVAATANCAQTPRTALPYAVAQGGQSLDGVDYPTSNGVNEWRNTVVTSTNMLSGPTATGTLTITGTNAGTLTATRTATGTATGTTTATSTASPTAAPPMTASATVAPRPDTIGVFKDGVWSLRLANAAGPADLTVNFGGPGFLPVVGDWNGDGVDTVGVFNPQAGTFSLSDSNTAAPPVDYAFVLGNPGDLPIAGRWEAGMVGDGAGVYRPTNGILYEKKTLTSGFADYFAIFGNPGDYGFAGDWDGDGFDSIGIYRPSEQNWYMTNNGTPTGITFSDLDFVWDIGDAVPVIGDWALTGKSSVGSFGGGTFTLHATAAALGANTVFAFGPTDGLPVAGRWAR